MLRSAAVLLGSAALLVPAAHAATPRAATVVAQDIEFRRATVTIARGGTVTWAFKDENAAHNVTSRGTKRFKSSVTKRSGTYRVRFSRAGTYRYVCTLHPGMDGKVVVR